MTIPLHAMWEDVNGNLLHGYDFTNLAWVDRQLALGLIFPNTVAVYQTALLRSSASFQQSLETLINVRVCLLVGANLDISFDNGVRWTPMSTDWIDLPAEAVSRVAVAGQLGPNDIASMVLRAQVPPNTQDFGIFLTQIAVDFDVQ